MSSSWTIISISLRLNRECKLGAYDVTKPLAEKHDVVNAAYFAEVERLSNCTRNAENADAWAANPMVRWVK